MCILLGHDASWPLWKSKAQFTFVLLRGKVLSENSSAMPHQAKEKRQPCHEIYKSNRYQ